MEDIEILGINKKYDLKELKKAYRLKIKELHPDKNLNDINSHFKMIQINKAYDNLKLLIDEKRKNEIETNY